MLQVEMIAASEMMRIQALARSKAADRSPNTFAQVQQSAMQEAATDNRMQWIRHEIYQQLESMRTDRSVANCAVDISPEGFKVLEENPEYRRQIMDLIRKDLGSSYAPRQAKLHIRVGQSIDEYEVHSWSAGDDTEFREVTSNSFYSRGNGRSVQRQFESYSSRAYQDFQTQLRIERDNRQTKNTEHSRSRTASAYQTSGYELPTVRAFQG